MHVLEEKSRDKSLNFIWFIFHTPPHFGGHVVSVSNAIDTFKSSIEGETATVPRETRQSYPPVWQSSATCHKTGRDILRNAGMGELTALAVVSRCCSFWLPFVSMDSTRPGSSAILLLWKCQIINRFKRRIVFSRWYPTVARKIEKSSGQWRTVLWNINR